MPTMVPSFLHRQIITTSCPSGRDRMQTMLDMVRFNNLDVSPLFSHRMKLRDSPRAYELFRSKADGILKVAITPWV